MVQQSSSGATRPRGDHPHGPGRPGGKKFSSPQRAIYIYRYRRYLMIMMSHTVSVLRQYDKTDGCSTPPGEVCIIVPFFIA